MKLFYAGIFGIASATAFLAGSKLLGGTLGFIAIVLAAWGGLAKKSATTRS